MKSDYTTTFPLPTKNVQKGVHLRDCDLAGRKLKLFRFEECIFTDIFFTDGCEFWKMTFANCIFINCHLDGLWVKHSSFSKTTFRNCCFYKSNFKEDTSFIGCVFQQCYLGEAVFLDVEPKELIFEQCRELNAMQLKEISTNHDRFSEFYSIGYLKEHFYCLNEAGSGGQACVYIARKRIDNEKVAIRIQEYGENKFNQNLFREVSNIIESINKLESPYVVRFHECLILKDINKIACIMTCAPGHTLYDLLYKVKSFAENPNKNTILNKITSELIIALNIIHRSNIFHRDIKPQNIMIQVNKDDSVNVTFIDFGLATLNVSNRKSICGTKGYMAPEVSLENNYDLTRSDLYSLGVTLCEMWNQWSRDPQKCLQCDKRKDSPWWCKIAQKCLEVNPENRWENCNQIIKKVLEKNKKEEYHAKNVC